MIARTSSSIAALAGLGLATALLISPGPASATASDAPWAQTSGTLRIAKQARTLDRERDYRQPPEGETLVVGAQFVIHRVVSPEFAPRTEAFWTALANLDAAMVELDPQSRQTATTGTSGFAVFAGLPLGIYQVSEVATAATAELDLVAPFLVTIPMPTGSRSTPWLFEVDLYPKNGVAAPGEDPPTPGEDPGDDPDDPDDPGVGPGDPGGPNDPDDPSGPSTPGDDPRDPGSKDPEHDPGDPGNNRPARQSEFDAALRTWVTATYGVDSGGNFRRIYTSPAGQSGPLTPTPHTASDAPDGADVIPGDLLVFAIRLFNQGTSVVSVDEVVAHLPHGVALAPADLISRTGFQPNSGWRRESESLLVWTSLPSAGREVGDRVVLNPGGEQSLFLILQVSETILDDVPGQVAGGVRVDQAEFHTFAAITALSGLFEESGLTSAQAAAALPVPAPVRFAWLPVEDADSEMTWENIGVDEQGNVVYHSYVDNVIHGSDAPFDAAAHRRGSVDHDRDNHDGERTLVVRFADPPRVSITGTNPVMAAMGSVAAAAQRVLHATGVPALLLLAAVALGLGGASGRFRRKTRRDNLGASS